MKKVLTLPKESRSVVFTCFLVQSVAIFFLATHPQLKLWIFVLSFLVSTYVTDLITAFGHFGFDYVWPDRMPILGPISVEFRDHHDRPTLDPSAWISNLTRGAYVAAPLALLAIAQAQRSQGPWQYFFALSTLGVSLWGLFFHQIHSYTHMGKSVPPDEFNAAVERISKLPKPQQKIEFAKLFERVGIPRWVRFMQKIRLFLRPEVHWQHHNTFDSDFSSLNGWSDPLTNIFFGPIARYKMAQKLKAKELSH